MADLEPASLQLAARRYLETLPDDERLASQAEVQRFVRWCGAERTFADLRGHEVAKYAETLTGTLTDATRRADAVRRFLAFAKKVRYSPTNLGAHLRLPKGAPGKPATAGPAPKEERLTEERKAALHAELAALKAQRPKLAQDIRRAMEDKDFRENAPLDVARQEQAYLEGRIRELETRLAHAVVAQPEAATSNEVVEIGSSVLLRNLRTDATITYTLVRPGEANAAQGRISFESPVGRALLQRRQGDEVEVAAPSGTLRFRIERIEG